MERHHCGRYEGAPPAVGDTLLGKKPRYAPDRTFDSLHIRLDLTVDFKAKSLGGLCTTTIKSLRDRLRKIEFQAGGMRISSASVDGRPVKFKHKDGRLNLQLPTVLHSGDEVEVAVKYKITRPKCGLHFSGPGPESPKAPVQMWTQGQPEDVHYWFPCHDHPQEKATSEVIALVPKGFVASSNGVLVSHKKERGGEVYHWRMHHPHSLYLMTLAAGRFSVVREKWEDVDIEYYCERGHEADAKRGFRATKPSMQIFSDKLGVRYPYERYAQIAASEFPGGMENTTATTQTDACLLSKQASLDSDLDLLVSHELAHHWFGDLVTCREWAHAWLNEGFATYMEMVFTEADKGADERDFELERNRHSYFGEDSSRYQRPIVSQNYRYPWVLFDRHLYEKGGWVCHMLRHELGEDHWWKSLRHYLLKHRNKSVETNDLIIAIQEATGRNLRWFFDQWIFKAGYPSYKVRWTWDAKTKKVEIRIEQKQSGQIFNMPLTLRFNGRGYSKDIVEKITKKGHTFHVKLPSEPTLLEVDPEHVLLKKLNIKKPLAMWLEQLRKSKTGRARARAAWHVAEWGDQKVVDALANCVAKDKFWGTAAEAAKALGSIKTPAARKALEKLLKVTHPRVRRAVVEALSHWPDAGRVTAPLISSDPSLHVRSQAAQNLGRMRDAKVIPRLKKALNHKGYWDIAAAGALHGLSHTRDRSALTIIRRTAKAGVSYPLRAHALRALGQWHAAAPEVVEDLIAALKSGDERILLPAIQTLGRLADRRAVEPIRKAKAEAHDTRVKAYADEALSRILGQSEKRV
jgi:aminopeptidase N